MKIFLAIVMSLISTCIYAQSTTSTAVVIVDSGKYEFKRQSKIDTPNFNIAFRILSNQVKLNPGSAELRYFLGYTIDRLNAADGNAMIKLDKQMTLRASEQFEEVNRLEPIYKGEVVMLDPYSKITAIWGSLAQAYLTRKLTDSAKWAFSEGKKRGGFQNSILEYNRQLLNSCGKNAILVTYGDNITISIWYLQLIENFRQDITAIDANLINTTWYPKYLKEQRHLKSSLSNAAIDTIEYMRWMSQIVTVINPMDTSKKFTWKLKPTYLDSYILKGDRILVDIVQQNFYERPIYFTNDSDSSYNLFLTPYLLNEGLVNVLKDKVVNHFDNPVPVSKNLYGYNIKGVETDDIARSRDAVIVLNYFRWAYLINVYQQVSQGNYAKAKELIKLININFPKEKLPFTSAQIEKYFTDFFQQIDGGNN